MKLFDKKFVHFMWDDELEGKEVIAANYITVLRRKVEGDEDEDFDKSWAAALKGIVSHSEDDEDFPFMVDGRDNSFVYYDPNYEVKKAFNEGKKIQYQMVGGVDWADIDNEEVLKCGIDEGRTFRIKPTENCVAYLARLDDDDYYLTACYEDRWKSVQESYGAKTKLFVGTEDEVREWYESREKFKDAIKAWEDGKTIQVYETLFNKWSDCAGTLEWYTDCEYRVKPECPCEDGIDSKACVGCEHSEDGKREYKPYVTVEEFIQDFQERFPTAVPRPAHTMPLIWVKTKSADAKFLVTGFMPDSDDGDYVEVHDYNCNMDDLLEYYVYLDGSPCGMEVKE